MMTYVVSPDRAKKANISSHADYPVAIGTVSEAHVLRTYGEELERRNQERFFR